MAYDWPYWEAVADAVLAEAADRRAAAEHAARVASAAARQVTLAREAAIAEAVFQERKRSARAAAAAAEAACRARPAVLDERSAEERFEEQRLERVAAARSLSVRDGQTGAELQRYVAYCGFTSCAATGWLRELSHRRHHGRCQWCCGTYPEDAVFSAVGGYWTGVRSGVPVRRWA